MPAGDDMGDFNSAKPEMPPNFSPGDSVFYVDRDGDWLPSRVVAVDISISPPSYCVDVGGRLRETERDRLRAADQVPAAAAPAETPQGAAQQPVAAHAPWAADGGAAGMAAVAEEANDDFGDFAAAEDIPSPPAAGSGNEGPSNGTPQPGVLDRQPDLHLGVPAGSSHAAAASAAPLSGIDNYGPSHALRGAFDVGADVQDGQTAGDKDGGEWAFAHVVEEPAGPPRVPFGSTMHLTDLEGEGGAFAGSEAGGTAHPQLEQGVDVDEDEDEDDFGSFESATAAAPPLAAAALPAASATSFTFPSSGSTSPSARVDARAFEVAAADTLPPASPSAAIAPSAFLTALGQHFLPPTSGSGPPPASPSGGRTAPGGSLPPVQEYGVAWVRLLQAAGAELRAGHAVWVDAHSAGLADQLLVHPEAQRRLAALGRVYFTAATVRLAAEQMGLLTVVADLQAAWQQCRVTWEGLPPPHSSTSTSAATGEEGAAEGDLPAAAVARFGQAVARASACVGSPLEAELAALEAAAAALPGLSMDEFPRMLTWTEGLDGLSLLPLGAFDGGHVPVERWAKGRPCKAWLVSLWVHRVSPQEPDLE